LPINPPDTVPSEIFEVLLATGSTKRIVEVLCQAAYEADIADEMDNLLKHVKAVAGRSGYITK